MLPTSTWVVNLRGAGVTGIWRRLGAGFGLRPYPNSPFAGVFGLLEAPSPDEGFDEVIVVHGRGDDA